MSKRTLRLFAVLMTLLMAAGLVFTGCSHKKQAEESATTATATVSSQDAGLIDDLKEKQSEVRSVAESKASSVASKAQTKQATTVQKTTQAQTGAATAKTTKNTQPTTTTLTRGLFQVSEDYKKSHTYCVAVNTSQNVVTIYKKGLDGNYSIPVKAMVCSCGRAGHETPSGQYTTLAKQRWLYLIDGSYGQYCTKFKEHYWFHSVPYYTQDPSNLEYNEYNKLGNNASAGCVRMSVKDVKWVYDNISLGTVVRVYSSSDKEPLIKPTPITIDTSDSNTKRGWDPTDPDSANPYKR